MQTPQNKKFLTSYGPSSFYENETPLNQMTSRNPKRQADFDSHFDHLISLPTHLRTIGMQAMSEIADTDEKREKIYEMTRMHGGYSNHMAIISNIIKNSDENLTDRILRDHQNSIGEYDGFNVVRNQKAPNAVSKFLDRVPHHFDLQLDAATSPGIHPKIKNRAIDHIISRIQDGHMREFNKDSLERNLTFGDEACSADLKERLKQINYHVDM